MRTAPRVLIVGCGFTGRVLARRLADAGHAVTGTVREAERAGPVADVGAEPVVLELGDALGSPEGRRRVGALVADHDRVVFAVGPARVGGGERFTDPVPAFLDAVHAAGARPEGFVYVSSTGVYGDRDGAWVDEATPVGDDLGPRGALRVAAEAALLEAWREWGLPARIVRPAGIYGPGRHVGLRIRSGAYRVIEADPPLTVNRIHVADLARTIEAALAGGAPGEVYVAADDRPATLREVADYAAGLLGLGPPPGEPLAEARKRMGDADLHLVADRKRCRNDKIKRDLKVRLAYPTYVEGLRAAMAADGLIPRGG